MPHPKRRTSKIRRDKRRTHIKAAVPTLSTCSTTGTVHERHRAYYVDGNLYYKGKLVIDSAAESA
jgi:large subunit ribosomal protein L32